LQYRKRELYDRAYTEIESILEAESTPRLDAVALMATINSVLANTFEDFFWTGFYRVRGNVLVVGPYIGTVGCLEISMGRGVCGTAAAERRTVIVPDVTQFPGHIACDPRSRSEIVVPVFGPDQQLVAVLDVDSERLAAFDADDQAGLERICSLFATVSPQAGVVSS
jgi:L-methionine (R)-S-oxide reductase